MAVARPNPLKLNPLQLRTLTVLQALADLPDYAEPGEGGAVRIHTIPSPHGDHFHLGPWIVLSRDITGLENPSVRAALDRKGLTRTTMDSIFLTAEGQAYLTGLRDQILHSSDH